MGLQATTDQGFVFPDIRNPQGASNELAPQDAELWMVSGFDAPFNSCIKFLCPIPALKLSMLRFIQKDLV